MIRTCRSAWRCGTNTVAFDYDSEHSRIRQVTGSNTTLYINDPASGLKVEKVTGATGSVQWNDYLFAGGQMVGEHFKVTTGGVTNTSTRYFTLDHLGSIAVIADETGTVLERLSYDAWGKRRFPTGADDPTGSITSQTTRGFTGHEMIDDVGLVNMNGRIGACPRAALARTRGTPKSGASSRPIPSSRISATASPSTDTHTSATTPSPSSIPAGSLG